MDSKNIGKFEILHIDKYTGARRGRLHTAHGIIETPIFMPVGTDGAVKTMVNQFVKDMGAYIILANTYHLFLRPGMEIISEFNGLHNFMNWDKPILTDSGGFQVFSLSKRRKIDENGVEFRSHLDGQKHLFTPEKVIDIEETIGSDIAMVLDVCSDPHSPKEQQEEEAELTYRWAKRAYEHRSREDQLVFGIVQGGIYDDLRIKSANDITSIPFDGYGIGGLSVGESIEDMYRVLDTLQGVMPVEKPRYLMGVGSPHKIVNAIKRGVDMFDCVLPTRSGRHGTVYTSKGKINLKSAKNIHNHGPIDENCDCMVCKNHSIAYVSHLIRAKEITGMILATYHNLQFLLDLTKRAREAIENDSFIEVYEEIERVYGSL
jgi:queuine tRNA-ribosyltransferase